MAYKVSQRRACRTFGFARSVVRYESKADPQTALRMRLRELAMARVGYGVDMSDPPRHFMLFAKLHKGGLTYEKRSRRGIQNSFQMDSS
jgi:hypothetical protein